MLNINLPKVDFSVSKIGSNESEYTSITQFRSHSEIPKTSGIYVFRNSKDEVLYVGQSKNLKSRMSTHFYRGAHLKAINHEVQHIDFYVIEDPMERAIYEIYMVNIFDSRYNAESKFYGKKTRISRKMKDRNM
ncbi:nucleotide excision repair endonuclease [Paenibacillus sp. GCM10027627]|uniref:nucleotide excision repair endonuclease n=1 Tax=unclassified Paenibacillus TaxID=185978 RepID=UPI003636D10F